MSERERGRPGRAGGGRARPRPELAPSLVRLLRDRYGDLGVQRLVQRRVTPAPAAGGRFAKVRGHGNLFVEQASQRRYHIVLQSGHVLVLRDAGGQTLQIDTRTRAPIVAGSEEWIEHALATPMGALAGRPLSELWGRLRRAFTTLAAAARRFG